MNAILKTGKSLALIGTLHSRKAFFFIKDRKKLIMQFFTTIELYSGDAVGNQRDLEAEVAITLSIEKGKQLWLRKHERLLASAILEIALFNGIFEKCKQSQ